MAIPGTSSWSWLQPRILDTFMYVYLCDMWQGLRKVTFSLFIRLTLALAKKGEEHFESLIWSLVLLAPENSSLGLAFDFFLILRIIN